MERHAVRSGELEDEKRGHQSDRGPMRCGYGGEWRESPRQNTERMKKY